MKRLLLLCSLLLPAAAARADEAPAGYAPYKLVGAMPQTDQALLWDEVGETYVLCEVGEELGDWRVVRLDAADGGRVRLVLAHDDLVDELPLVRLPSQRALVLSDAAAARPGPARPAPAKLAFAVTETRAIRRAVLLRELDDLDKLTGGARLESLRGGGVRIAKLDSRSFPAALGFREGDVVRKVAGEPVTTVDDAARVYARLSRAASITADIERGTDRVTLRIDLE